MQELKPGVYASPSDPEFPLKSFKYQRTEPDSPLHEASILVRAGKIEQAKSIYFRLLKSKETLYVHSRLATLLSQAEALHMLEKYEDYPRIKMIYQQRLSDTTYLTHKKDNLPILVLLITLAILLGMLIGTLTYFEHKQVITVEQTTTNQVLYVNKLSQTSYQKEITVQNRMLTNVVHAVDHDNMFNGTPYELILSQEPIGYAVRKADNRYAIYLLNAPTPSSASLVTAGQQSSESSIDTHSTTSSVSPLVLNIARTAYTQYLSTHNDVPPRSLQAISSWVPNSQLLSKIQFKPTTNPTTALTSGSGAVPYIEPKIFVNLSSKQMQVTYGGATLLSTSIGIGSSKSPTPTGQFTVTNRIPSPNKNVYGPYVFPLNGTHYAIHGTHQNSRLNRADSIGCVEVSDAVDAKLFQLIPVGTQVTIANGDALKPPAWFLG